jgi:hypothetical protein
MLRETFKVEHGDHLPDDLCLAIENLPTRWEVFPVSWTSALGVTAASWAGSSDINGINGVNGTSNINGAGHVGREREEVETVPEVDADLLAEARERVAVGDGGLLASLASI